VELDNFVFDVSGISGLAVIEGDRDTVSIQKKRWDTEGLIVRDLKGGAMNTA
jgi:hypothetical protein